MKVELAVALVSGAVALLAAGIAVWGNLKAGKNSAALQLKLSQQAADLERFKIAEQQRIESEKVTSRFREPLARTAYDLQSRLYNILNQNLIGVFLVNGSDREKNYVIDNTAFVIAQYFAWTEIIRREIQFIDLGSDDETRHLRHLQDDIYALWQTDAYPPMFRIFAGEQRALGETMVEDGPQGPECIGYGAFISKLPPGTDKLVDAVRADVRALDNNLDQARPRLTAVQNALIDLLKFLDPDYVRFPKVRRSKA